MPVNVKIIIEREEEVGSENLDRFVEEHTELLKADLVVISDSGMFAKGVPSICYSLRGLSYMEVEVTGPNRDLHSGSFGGSVHNPVQALCEMIASLHDKNGKITVKGFYDDVRPLTKVERNRSRSCHSATGSTQKTLVCRICTVKKGSRRSSACGRVRRWNATASGVDTSVKERKRFFRQKRSRKYQCGSCRTRHRQKRPTFRKAF